MQTYGLIVAVSLLLCMVITHLLGKERFEKQVTFWGTALPLAFIFSRLFYVLPNLQYYFEEISYPLAIVYFWDGGASLFGALIGLLLALYWSKDKVSKRYVDALFVGLWVLVAGMRIAESFTGMGLGRPSADGVENFFVIVKNDYAHLAVYRLEAIFALLMFIVSLYLFLKLQQKGASLKHAYLSYFLLIMLSASQVVFESLRNDDHMLIGFVHVQQVMFAIFMIALMFVIRFKLNRDKRINIWLMIALILILFLIDFAMEFVVDGRLHFPIPFFGFSPFARNYIIISLVSICFMVLGAIQLIQLYKENTSER